MNKKLIGVGAFIIFTLILLKINKVFGLALVALFLIYFAYRALPFFYLIRANKKYALKEIAEALSIYEKAASFKHSSPKVKLLYTYILLKQGEINKSELLLKELLKIPLNKSDKIDTTLNYSLALWKSNKLSEAIIVLEKLYNDGYRITSLYQNLGFFYIIEGDLEKSLNFNLEAYDYSNTDASILDNLALNYYLMGRYDEAIELYNKIIPMNPAFVTPYYYFALALKAKEDYEKALEMLEKALQCNFSFLSYVTKSQVEAEISKIENSKYSLD